MQSLRILVTDTQELAGLGAVRSLGRAGHRVIAGHPHGVDPPARRSRWCAAAVAYPDPWQEHGAFRDWLRAQLQGGRYDVVLPIAEAAIFALAQMRADLPTSVTALFPRDEHLRITLSKVAAARTAADVGLPLASTVFVREHADRGAWNDDLSQLHFPIVIKTDNALLPTGQYRKGTCVVARTAEHARAVLASMRDLPCAVLAQEFIAGTGAGVSLLRWGGVTRLAFTHRRLHEVPWTGGASSLRVSDHDPVLEAHARRLLDVVDYSGLAMVEFRCRNSDRVPFFVEVNGRLWGSIALCLHAGIDFPTAFLDCVRMGNPTPERRTPTYRAGILCRNVYPGEFRHLFSVLKAEAKPNLPPPPSKIRTILNFFLRFLDPRVRYDVLWLSDPLPAFAQSVVMFGDLRGGLRYRLRRMVAFLHCRLIRIRTRVRAFSVHPRSILFLCHGNILRSPFAEHLWNARASFFDTALTCRAASAGFIPIDGRRTPPEHLPIARACGVDLSVHRSRRVREGDIAAADAIFVMDYANMEDLLAAFPRARAKAYFLGAFSGDRDIFIPDPYKLSHDRARAAFEKIARSIDGLARCIASRP